MVLYSAVSRPLDRSKRFTLSSPDIPVHSDTNSASLGRRESYAHMSIVNVEEMTTASTRPPLEIRRTQLSKLMSPHNHRTDRPRYKDAPSSGRAVIPTVENQGLSVLQLNAEGLTNAKLEVIRQLADSNQVAVVLLQETHRPTDDNLKLPGFLLAGSISMQ